MSESNNYDNLKQEYKVTKKDLNIVALRTTMINASFNYERMQANGILYALAPLLKKIHTNMNDLKKSMKTHLDFFNTHTYIVSIILGLIVAMEEKKEDPELIRSTKVALMGPLAGIGDSLIWFTLLPILAGIGSALAIDGNILGPILFFVLFNICENIIRFGLLHYSYNLGLSAITKLSDISHKLTRVASIIGMIVIGALIANYVNFSLALEIKGGEATINVQKDVLDKLIPNILPLLYTFLMFYLVKKRRVSPMKLVILTVILAVFGTYLGIF